MREAISDLSANKSATPRDRESFDTFLSNIKDEKFGLGGKPVSLLDVLSKYDDLKEKDGFDFFEEYYNSETANKNIERSNEVLEIVYFNEDEDDLVSKIAFQPNQEISKKVVTMFREKYEAAEEKMIESSESTSNSKEEKKASESSSTTTINSSKSE